MKRNVGSADRIIRILIAVILIFIYATGKVSGALSIVTVIAAVVMLLTALFNFCPLYTLLRINTGKTK